MNENEFFDLGAAAVKKKKKVFMVVGLTLIGLALVFVFAVIFGDEEEKEQMVTGIGAAVLFLAVGIVLLVMMFKQNKLLQDREKVFEIGKTIHKQNQEKEALEAAELRKKSPDFDADKTFKGAKSYVWISTENKLIQFNLPTGEYAKTEDKAKYFAWLFNPKEEVLRKTKVLSLASLADIQFIDDEEDVTTTDLNGYLANANNTSSGNASVTLSTTTYHYYEIDFTFNDLDEPVVHIFFNDDGEQAERLYQTVKILINKKADINFK